MACKRSVFSIFRFSGGFTLIEIVIAMTLVSAIALIAAMALKMTVQAWESGAEEGESRYIQTILPALLEKQLAARVVQSLFAKTVVTPEEYFCGSENSLSFLTTYAPQGSLHQGVLWIKYIFDQPQGRLMIYSKSVTRVDDLREDVGAIRRDKTQKWVSVGQVDGIADFKLLYTNDFLFDTNDLRQWHSEWNCGMESSGIPSGIMLEMRIGEDLRYSRWFYRIPG